MTKRGASAPLFLWVQKVSYKSPSKTPYFPCSNQSDFRGSTCFTYCTSRFQMSPFCTSYRCYLVSCQMSQFANYCLCYPELSQTNLFEMFVRCCTWLCQMNQSDTFEQNSRSLNRESKNRLMPLKIKT